MSDTQIGIIKIDSDASVDEYLSRVCLTRTMGDVVKMRESAMTAKAYTIASMVFNAVFEMDVELIKTIAFRVDGTVPEENKRDSYANLLGDAIEDVLSYDEARMLTVTPDDTAIIAMAKVLVYVATRSAGTNYMARKERNLAASMILERTGGRKVGPTKPLLTTEYVEPDWMGLPEGEEND
jgi:hypothetical protein